jgi:hypothetical protein
MGLSIDRNPEESIGLSLPAYTRLKRSCQIFYCHYYSQVPVFRAYSGFAVGSPQGIASLDLVRQSDISTLGSLECAALELRRIVDGKIVHGARVEAGPLRYYRKQSL